MARIEIDDFGEGTELVRVYLASRVAEAEAAEAALAGAGLEYAVEVETLPTGGLLGFGRRTGAGLWIRSAELDAGLAALRAKGLVAGLVDPGD